MKLLKTRKKKQDQRRELEKDLKISKKKVSNSHKEATESIMTSLYKKNNNNILLNKTNKITQR